MAFEPVSDDNSVVCSICLDILTEPHLTSCCGIHFCGICISAVKDRKDPCPVCREPAFKIMLDKHTQRKLNSFIVHCHERAAGCKWTGELGKLKHHLESCTFEKFYYVCQFCGIRSLYEADVEGTHKNVCPKAPAKCPNECIYSEGLTNETLVTHLQDECVFRSPEALQEAIAAVLQFVLSNCNGMYTTISSISSNNYYLNNRYWQ